MLHRACPYAYMKLWELIISNKYQILPYTNISKTPIVFMIRLIQYLTTTFLYDIDQVKYVIWTYANNKSPHGMLCLCSITLLIFCGINLQFKLDLIIYIFLNFQSPFYMLLGLRWIIYEKKFVRNNIIQIW